MTPIRRLDHVAVLVADTERALLHFRDRLGLAVRSTEVIAAVNVRLTYLDAGNAFVQLVEPLDPESPLGRTLRERGEGLHHICFGVEDVVAGATALATPGAPLPTLGSGRGRRSAFVPGPIEHGARLEVTEFRRGEDVGEAMGWLPP